MYYKKVFKFHIFSIIFSIILGILLHFAFEWSGNNLFIATFSAVNESTWEHLKLVFFPMLITIIISYFYLSEDASKCLCTKTCGIISAMLFITVCFYTYTGILGTNYSSINSIIFILSVILAEYVTYKKMNSISTCNPKNSIIILLILLISFILFTYSTPKINYFKNPISNEYGLNTINKS